MRRRGCNVEVTLRPGESQEKLLRRFVKKCKTGDIIKEYLDRVSFFKSKGSKRREKRLKAAWIRTIEREEEK